MPVGAAGAYAKCSSNADCQAPLACVKVLKGFACLAWCVTSNTCGANDTCINPLNPPLFVGATSYGFCYNGVA